MSVKTVSHAKVLLAASKKLRFKSDSAIERTCEFAGMGAADAYRCGAEEAQNEIISRLQAVPPYPALRPSSASTVTAGAEVKHGD